MSFAILNEPKAGANGKGLDVFDPRLADITGLTQKGKFVEAIAAIEAVFEEDVYDLRLLGFYVYGVFLERGLACFEEAFTALERCLTEHWDIFGPEKNKAKHAQGSLSWLFKQLEKSLVRRESSRGPDYLKWVDTISAEDTARMSQSLELVRTAVDVTLADQATPAIEAISKVSSWLSEFERSVYVKPTAAPAEAAEPEQAVSSATGPTAVVAASAPSAAMVEGSVHLVLLLKKLEAFERLFQQGELSRAAIVADDLVTILSDFDPRKYFPGIFASFFRVLALNVSSMDEHFQAKGGPEWQAMNDFYQVDLEGFVEPEGQE